MLPEYAAPAAQEWFDLDSVSSFEARMLPEFFTGRSAHKTPESYAALRNQIVRMWRRLVSDDGPAGGLQGSGGGGGGGGAATTAIAASYLTATSCRRRLAGDAGSILRVHEFLERFGVIN
ncbi:unnamed protein product, partial [Phaeothamnion confervicola]